MRKRKWKWKLPNWLDLTLSFHVPYLQHSTFHLLLSQSADCQNPWENCEILSLFSKIWLFHSTMCWIHFWSSTLIFKNFSMFFQLTIFNLHSFVVSFFWEINTNASWAHRKLSVKPEFFRAHLMLICQYRKVASSRGLLFNIELFWPKITVHKHQISPS